MEALFRLKYNLTSQFLVEFKSIALDLSFKMDTFEILFYLYLFCISAETRKVLSPKVSIINDLISVILCFMRKHTLALDLRNLDR